MSVSEFLLLTCGEWSTFSQTGLRFLICTVEVRIHSCLSVSLCLGSSLSRSAGYSQYSVPGAVFCVVSSSNYRSLHSWQILTNLVTLDASHSIGIRSLFTIASGWAQDELTQYPQQFAVSAPSFIILSAKHTNSQFQLQKPASFTNVNIIPVIPLFLSWSSV